eukprot:Nk52_evm1s374 gene=Nk52_evmTU1s374
MASGASHRIFIFVLMVVAEVLIVVGTVCLEWSSGKIHNTGLFGNLPPENQAIYLGGNKTYYDRMPKNSSLGSTKLFDAPTDLYKELTAVYVFLGIAVVLIFINLVMAFGFVFKPPSFFGKAVLFTTLSYVSAILFAFVSERSRAKSEFKLVLVDGVSTSGPNVSFETGFYIALAGVLCFSFAAMNGVFAWQTEEDEDKEMRALFDDQKTSKHQLMELQERR